MTTTYGQTRRRNIAKAMTVLKAAPYIDDDMIMAANAKGQEARNNGAVPADNPYVAHLLREAWLDGWHTQGEG